MYHRQVFESGKGKTLVDVKYSILPVVQHLDAVFVGTAVVHTDRQTTPKLSGTNRRQPAARLRQPRVWCWGIFVCTRMSRSLCALSAQTNNTRKREQSVRF